MRIADGLFSKRRNCRLLGVLLTVFVCEITVGYSASPRPKGRDSQRESLSLVSQCSVEYEFDGGMFPKRVKFRSVPSQVFTGKVFEQGMNWSLDRDTSGEGESRDNDRVAIAADLMRSLEQRGLKKRLRLTPSQELRTAGIPLVLEGSVDQSREKVLIDCGKSLGRFSYDSWEARSVRRNLEQEQFVRAVGQTIVELIKSKGRAE